ncbi:MAG: hypothetical protein K6B46_00185 [Opitutales bacterium]|nr:hypothetical protein [Opitutales bacterium]
MLARIFHWLWLPILLAVSAGTAWLFFAVPVKIESSFFSLLPLSQNSAVKREAIEKISRNSAGLVHAIFVPADAEHTLDALERQKTFARAVTESGIAVPDKIADPDPKKLKAIAALFKPYRLQLLSQTHATLLEEGRLDALAETALAELNAPVTARLLPVRDDPYGFLTAFFAENPLLRAPFRFIDGVPVANIEDGVTAAYLPLRLNNTNALSEIVGNIGRLQALQEKFSDGNVRVELAGVPVHTAISASKSLNEINLLSVASLIFLFAIFFAVFRSLKTFFVGTGTLVLAGTLAFAGTNAIFGSIHTLTLLFGCSLLGIAVDYILHLVIAGTLTKPLARALIFSAGTTCLAFAVFLFVDVELLRQIATFTLIGIATAVSLTLGVLARFDFLKKSFARNKAQELAGQIAGTLKAAGTKKNAQIWVFAFLFIAGLIGIARGNYSEDLKNLYEPGEDLKIAEKHCARILDYQNSQNFLVVAQTELELLDKCSDFEDAILKKNPDAGVGSIAQIVPPLEKQLQNFYLACKALNNPPAAFPIRIKNLPAMEVLKPSKLENNALLPELSLLFGGGNEEFYAIVTVRNADKKIIQEIARTNKVLNLDFIAETNLFLEKCRNRCALYLLVAVAGTLLIFCLRHGIRTGARMILPTLGALAGTAAFITACGFSLSLFHLLALFLIFGFGIDYIIHRAENAVCSRNASLSILLSCVTTFVAFGFLSFTAFPLTREMGLLIAFGIVLSYALSHFVDLDGNGKNISFPQK